jgi:hypothetical protein
MIAVADTEGSLAQQLHGGGIHSFMFATGSRTVIP